MNKWQITEQNRLSGTTTTENLQKVDDVKVKTTKCYITTCDLEKYGNPNVNYPIVPCTIAVGQVVESINETDYLSKGSKVFLSPSFAKNNEGYLKDFVVLPSSEVYALPKIEEGNKTIYLVSENDAMFLSHVSIALSVIDKLNVNKGNHVAILGGSYLANIIAQRLSQYQSVPIVIDSDDERLELARKTNVFYTIKNNKDLETEINSITGGRKCSKVIYVTDSDCEINTVDKVASNNATVVFAGISSTKTKLSCNFALNKQLNISFINDTTENIVSGINLLRQKAIDLSFFDLPVYKFEYAPKHFENAYAKIDGKSEDSEFIIDML